MTEVRWSRSPLAQLAVIGRPTLYVLGLLAALKALALIMMAGAAAAGTVSVIDGSQQWRVAVLWGLASAVLRALVTWGHRVVAARSMLGAKERLRAQLAEKVVSDRQPDLGSTTTLATHGLDELDKYFTVFLPALVNAACVPLLVGARILFADWPSALIIVLTVPLIPVFMVLIGMHTTERVAAAMDSLARLSDHLVELARGLPVLIGLGRAREQSSALRRISEDYRERTIQTLRTAFLSSLALELISTISVALVAVTIGVRLVSGGMPLETGLLVLLLAPECFAPFRDIGAAFHGAEEGREALRRVRELLDRPTPKSIVRAGTTSVLVDGLTVQFADRSIPSVQGLGFSASKGHVTLLDGPSGSGKSTVLAVLNGSLCEAPEAVRITGGVTGVDSDRIAWMPQHPHAVASSVLEELLLYRGDHPEAEAEASACLDLLRLARHAAADPNRLSPGELRRLAFGRVMMRVRAGAELVLLDEPTAHLDAVNAATVVSAISALRAEACVIVASHDDRVRALADTVVTLGGGSSRGAGSRPLPPSTEAAAGADPVVGNAASGESPHPFLELTAFLRPVVGRLLAATLLGLLSTVFAIALLALSGWLIVRASQHPPIMYLMVAIVGVRFFGIGRSVLRYTERLLSHNTIFAALTELRMRLWLGLAARGARDRGLLSGGNTLDRLVRDVDRARDLSIRALLPPMIGALTAVTAVVALGVVYPPSLLLFAVLAVIAVVAAPGLAIWADRAAGRAEHLIRSEVVRRFAALLGAAGDLRANRVDGAARRELQRLDLRAGLLAKRGSLALGLGNALVVFSCSAAAVLVLPLTAGAVAAGTLAPEWVAVLVLTPLGLIDPFSEVVAAVQQWPAFRSVLASISTVTTAKLEQEATVLPPPEPITRISLERLSARWPAAAAPVFTGLDAQVDRSGWLVVTGPSGSGKSTLLAVLLGHLRPWAGRYLVNDTDTRTVDSRLLRRRIAWCPQEGHLFNSTLRANLLLARGRDDAPGSGEMIQVLRRVGLSELLDRLPLGLDCPIGAEGGRLSGGERQRVAVARTLLSRADVILIDEPTAHLDEDSAERLIADLRVALRDQLTVLVTHHPVASTAGDRVLILGSRVEAEVMVGG